MDLVAPCVGAWIEIASDVSALLVFLVAPCVGAWIEIVSMTFCCGICNPSLLAWERGLKLIIGAHTLICFSRSLRGSVD